MSYSLAEEIKRNDPRQKKWKEQREKRGFDDTELWSLDCTICSFLVDRLTVFKEYSQSHPSDLTYMEWQDVLQEMIDGFEDYNKAEFVVKKSVKFDRAMELLTTYFNRLWD